MSAICTLRLTSASSACPKVVYRYSSSRYTLIRLFQRYGKVTRLDFLFHKAGPQRGKPRGYAFVEYANAQVSIYASC